MLLGLETLARRSGFKSNQSSIETSFRFNTQHLMMHPYWAAMLVLMLNSFRITLPVPSEPAFFMLSSIDPEFRLCEYSSGANDSNQSTSKYAHFSNNEASIFELH
ncbi:hypothetical protein RJ640_005588 [Escallonia rubra]|uniref:Uncharacterized protein n=1 Tax=Escallonia rubra TaxID=112253 RepID=A0AA88U824_9ASTE|nr:hypothetical protein RJ640_005588 [Escallonia rubra]